MIALILLFCYPEEAKALSGIDVAYALDDGLQVSDACLKPHSSICLCRHHKLRVLVGGWWRKSNRPAPQDLFLDYDDIPKEPRLFLERYILI